MPEPGARVHGLFEAHLNVRNLARSVAFYRDVVGLALAYELPERQVAFFWCGEPGAALRTESSRARFWPADRRAECDRVDAGGHRLLS